MTRARRELVSLDATPYYHCICRCVRRAFLCGEDLLTGKNYEHRKLWIIERLRELQAVFAVDIGAYAVMSNHYHLVLRLNVQKAERWSEAQVVRRWAKLFQVPLLVDRYHKGLEQTLAEQTKARQLIAQWRARLADLSWYMRCLNEHLARRANEEDRCTGRFWEGRFKSQALLDEAAVLTCMSYVDLNPIRAGLATTPEGSNFTSIQQRIAGYAKSQSKPNAEKHAHPRPRLMALTTKNIDKHPNHLGFSLRDYLELIDWAGRAVREDKRGAIPPHLPPILQRLGLHPARYLEHVEGRAHGAETVMMGHLSRMREVAAELGRKFVKGLNHSRQLYLEKRNSFSVPCWEK